MNGVSLGCFGFLLIVRGVVEKAQTTPAGQRH